MFNPSASFFISPKRSRNSNKPWQGAERPDQMETLPWSPEQVAAAHEVADPVEPSDEEILKNGKKVIKGTFKDSWFSFNS